MHLNVQSASGGSYVVLEVTDPDALPTSGTTENSITIADGRNDTFIRYADVIVSTSMIDAPQPSELEQQAAAMGVGTWAQLTGVSNQDSALGVGAVTGSMLPFVNTMPWNPVDRCVEIIGADHNGTPRHVRFDEATHSYVVESANTGFGTPMHGYDHNSVNPYTGDIYHRLYSAFTGEISVTRRLQGGTSWAQIADVTGLEQVAIGSCWWSGSFTGGSGLGAQGGLVIFNSGNSTNSSNDGEIHVFDPVADDWVFSNDGMFPNYGSGATYHSVIEYSPVHNCAVYGGGNVASNRLKRLNSDGTFTDMPNTPSGMTVGMQNGILTVDPVTGNFLLLSNGSIAELDPTGSGTWTVQTGSRVPPAAVGDPNDPDNMTISSITDYGVIMVITQNTSSGGNTYLYKHAGVSSGIVGSAAIANDDDTASASGLVSGALGVQRTLSFLET
jgi:hypothetical protein